jgi:hypothetical protein
MNPELIGELRLWFYLLLPLPMAFSFEMLHRFAVSDGALRLPLSFVFQDSLQLIALSSFWGIFIIGGIFILLLYSIFEDRICLSVRDSFANK